MTLNQTLADTGESRADEALQPYSAAWWQRRTAEELRDIIKRGFAGGDAFQGAVSETERRAREETRRLRDLAALAAERAKMRKRVVLGSIALVVIAAFAGFLVSG